MAESWWVRSTDFKEIPLCTAVRPAQKGELWMQAFKAGGRFFAIAVISIFIPAAHFLLVPTFLILTAVTFWRSLHLEFRLVQREVTCPVCLKPTQLSSEFIVADQRFRCDHCHCQLVLTKKIR